MFYFYAKSKNSTVYSEKAYIQLGHKTPAKENVPFPAIFVYRYNQEWDEVVWECSFV